MFTILYQRVFQLFAVIFSVGGLTFLLMRALPGDMAYRIAASRYGQDNVNEQAAEFVRQELALNQTGWHGFMQWMLDIAQFNFGHSLVSGESVFSIVEHQLTHSIMLAGTGMLMSIIIAIPIGLCSALWPRHFNLLAFTFSALFRSLPVFVIGLILILLFALHWSWFPVAGFGTPNHLVLPALTLAISLAAASNRIIYHSAQDTFRAPFYSFARTKGLGTVTTFRRHGIINIALPVVAYWGVQLVIVLEGVVMIESLFSWPGVGHGLAHAIFARDIPVIQGTAICLGILFVILNTINDLICRQLDPRSQQPKSDLQGAVI
ncbi:MULTISPECIES: ABC transporter permease [Vibrio]|uniref:ABC transporter permease n=1 Tax=Vibrio casei TaxID=673372 RepID=A0A368LHA6_9VIBR|nr:MULTISPECIES: ABC transporter permease [Vibrio]RCS70006.1 ABC transporter permease [Vibrio casei]SJN33740.1 ABC transporter, permease protein [Vibrio casei]HBV77455.1 ABC transporter permease [Vibrio sp.]